MEIVTLRDLVRIEHGIEKELTNTLLNNPLELKLEFKTQKLVAWRIVHDLNIRHQTKMNIIA